MTILDDDLAQVVTTTTTTSTTRPGAPGGSISRTGADSGPMALIGLGAMAVGAGFVLLGRRRRLA